MKTYTEKQIADAIKKSYERNQFNEIYFWHHLAEEKEV
jgi:hypothetical protein